MVVEHDVRAFSRGASMKPHKKGKKWYYVRRENGKVKWTALKTESKEEAMIRMGELLRQRHRERFGVAKDPQNIEWPELVKRFLDQKRANGDAPSTIRRAEGYFKVVDRVMGVRMASEWSSELLETFKLKRLREGRAPGTINKEVESIRAALRRAKRWGFIAPSAEDLEDVRKVKKSGKQAFYFTDFDAKRLFAAAKPMWRIAILLGLRGGLRRSEVLNLLWEDLDFVRREIRVVNRPGAHTKNRKSRILPMDEALAAVLFAWQAVAGGWPRVVPWRNLTDGGKSDFSREFKRLLNRLEFPRGASFHSLRHTFATNLTKANVSPFKIASMLGHHSPVVTVDYTHVELDDMREALRSLPAMPKISNALLTVQPTPSNIEQLVAIESDFANEESYDGA